MSDFEAAQMSDWMRLCLGLASRAMRRAVGEPEPMIQIVLSCGCESVRDEYRYTGYEGDEEWCHEHPKDEDDPDQVTIFSVRSVLARTP